MRISQRRDEIVDRWTAEAQKSASARGLSGPELQNIMPEYVSALAEGKPLPELRVYFESHLADRLRLGFDLAEMIEEFSILERCLAAVLDGLPQGERPTSDERARLFSTLQATIVAVGDMFQEHMRMAEQREKRYVRKLEAIASAGLHDPAVPLRSRLREAAQVVREAMNADTAAILLYDPVTEGLIVHASAGVAEAELARYATGLSPSTFAGQVAAHPEPVFVADAATTELEVSEPLRRSGVHALLGVRLPKRARLLGVMYIGLCEQRRFTGGEIGRLEMLGDRLTLHLDNAQLYAELRERIEELGVERALRDQLVAIVAHDLRSPLTAARLDAELLAKDAAGARPRHLVRQLDRADRMIRDLLDMSRVRAGERLSIDVGPCDLRAVVQDVVAELRAAHGDRFDLQSDGPVQGFWSRDDLHRLMWNLGENAVKYGAPGARIGVDLERRGDRARLSVHNSGNPIPPEDQPRLFDGFVRGASPPPSTPGWGLGLAFVRACAEAHGGEVALQSSPEAGTTFAVTLPMDSRPYQPQHPAPQ